jgi:hypothetical protein
MYRIYCDETWTAKHSKAKGAYHVFYGVMVDEAQEAVLLQAVNEFRQRRGLLTREGTSIEVKWQRVEDEWKQAKHHGHRNRYEELLDLFFASLEARKLSFGYMFLQSSEYRRVESDFQEKQPDNRHNFFFMLYFQFLYHCFIRTQVKQKPCEIYIDNRNMGEEDNQYDVSQLRDILNRRLHRDISPRNQPILSWEFQERLTESIQLVDLAESKQEPLIQLSDLCAGCIRYVLENQLPATPPKDQMLLFGETPSDDHITPGRHELVQYFYSKLRSIDRYKDINLLKVSRHYCFNIFPFEFGR